MEARSDQATQLLNRLSAGDRSVSNELMELIYGELHALARAFMKRERDGHTLQPTALVHEAYLKLVGQEGASWKSRRHFYSLAAKVMRSLLVDHARERGAKKRGGDRARLTLDDVEVADAVHGDEQIDWLDLNDGLTALAELDAGLAEVVELRYFGGLTVRETASALELSVRTVERRLQVGGAWLRERLDGA